MKRPILFSLLIFTLVLSAFRFNPQPTRAASLGYSLRFRGHGTNDIDRVKIKLDAPAVPADVSGNFTIEFWLKATLADNSSAACAAGGSSSTQDSDSAAMRVGTECRLMDASPGAAVVCERTRWRGHAGPQHCRMLAAACCGT